jgi:LCCL domain
VVTHISCLSAPVGLLDRTWKVREHECDVFWEKYVLHFTQPLRKAWIFWPLAAAYIVSLAFFARANYFFTPPESFIDCTAAYWQRLDECGLDGVNCQPFSGAVTEFRCPAGCMEVILENIRTIGDQEVDFVPLVVGGGDNNQTYRGDSFLCAAGIHA